MEWVRVKYGREGIGHDGLATVGGTISEDTGSDVGMEVRKSSGGC